MQEKTKNYDLSTVLKKEHEGKWVALSTDYSAVVEYADTPHELKQKVGNKDVVFIRALPTGLSFAF